MTHTPSLPDRIAAKIAVDEATGCWLWTAATSKAGYGVIQWDGSAAKAHRVVYQLLVGPISHTLDHVRGLCRNKNCVNPEHLEDVTAAENTARSNRVRRKTHCPRGHPYDEHGYSWISRRPGRSPSLLTKCKLCANQQRRTSCEKA